MIKAIIFDMNGVLISNFDPQIYENHAQKLNLTTQDFKEIIKEFFNWSITNKAGTLDDFWNTKKNNWGGIALEDLKEFTADLHASEKINEEIIEIARSLKKNYKIGVLSNIGGVNLEKLFEEKYDIKNFFDYVLSTGHIGIAKPDPAVYKHMLSKMNMEPEEVVFIDDKENNVQSAAQMGIHGIHFISPDMPSSILIEKLKDIEIELN